MEILFAFGQMALAAMVLACCYGAFGFLGSRSENAPGTRNGGAL